jgi:hypothetical protein
MHQHRGWGSQSWLPPAFSRRLEFLVRPKGADHQWGKDPLK